MEKILIRQATKEDVEAIHELHVKSVRELCQGFYSDELIDGWIGARTPANFFPAIDRDILFVAIRDAEMVGFGGAIPGEIWAIYVSPGHVKSGIGSILLSHAMEIALAGKSSVILESTLNASKFYEKKGFVELERTTATHGNVYLPVIKMKYKPPIKKKS